MVTIPRRAYLASVGSAAIVLPVGVVGAARAGGALGAGRRLDYERKPNGDIEFDDPETGTHFETRGDDIQYDDEFSRCREEPSIGRCELTRTGAPGSILTELDIERQLDVNGRIERSEFRIEILGEAIEYEKDDTGVEFTSERYVERFEDEAGDDIEFRGRYFDFDVRADRIDVKSTLRFRFDGIDDTRFRDGGTDLSVDSRRFQSKSDLLDIDFDRGSKEFEARRIG